MGGASAYHALVASCLCRGELICLLLANAPRQTRRFNSRWSHRSCSRLRLTFSFSPNALARQPCRAGIRMWPRETHRVMHRMHFGWGPLLADRSEGSVSTIAGRPPGVPGGRWATDAIFRRAIGRLQLLPDARVSHEADDRREGVSMGGMPRGSLEKLPRHRGNLPVCAGLSRDIPRHRLAQPVGWAASRTNDLCDLHTRGDRG